MNGHPQVGDVGELDGVVLTTVDGLRQIAAHLRGVDVKSRDEFEVANVVATEFDVHESRHVVARGRVTVERHALNQRAGAVADSRNSHTDVAHGGPFLLRFVSEGWCSDVAT